MGSQCNHWFTHRIKKELSICQSSLCLDLVSFPVLSQIKPQAPACSEQYFQCIAPPKLSAIFRLPLRSHLSVGADYILNRRTAHCHLVCELHPSMGFGCRLALSFGLLPYLAALMQVQCVLSLAKRYRMLLRLFRRFDSVTELRSSTSSLVAAVRRWSYHSTPGGALPSIPLSFSLATILPPEPKNFDFS